MKQAASSGFFLSSLFDPEEEGDTFFRNAV
jgi:hypothetical protein